MSEIAANPEIWTQFRQQMPVAEQWVYFDHAAVGPLSAPARAAVLRWATEAAEHGDVHWPDWAKRLSSTRSLVAKGLNASNDEIAFVANTSDGISLVANGLTWEPGDNIVMPSGEFPSNYYPWKALESDGVELRVVETDEQGRFSPSDIARACDSRTKLIATSWVGFASGFRCDVAGIAEVAQRFEAKFFLDAIQGLGIFPLDVASLPVDFLAADGHKWMLGPEGFGVLYVRRERLDDLRPNRLGWNSVRHTFDYHKLELDLKPNAQRFEAGSHNMVCAQAFAASVELLIESGWGPRSAVLGDRVVDRRRQLGAIVSDLGAEVFSSQQDDECSGILSFGWADRDPVDLRRQLLDRHIVLSCRNGRLRISAHGYNDDTDLERFQRSLGEIL